MNISESVGDRHSIPLFEGARAKTKTLSRTEKVGARTKTLAKKSSESVTAIPISDSIIRRPLPETRPNRELSLQEFVDLVVRIKKIEGDPEYLQKKGALISELKFLQKGSRSLGIGDAQTIEEFKKRVHLTSSAQAIREKIEAMVQALEELEKAQQKKIKNLVYDDVVARGFPPELARQFCGRWILRKKLGAGGMGEVWEAFDYQMSASRVIKFYVSRGDSHRKRMVRFKKEGQMLANLPRHQNLLAVYDAGVDVEVGGWLAMDKAKGPDLRAYLNEKKKLECGEVIQLMLEAARGLEVVHKANLLHRDIKPQNFIIDTEEFPDGSKQSVVKLADFGLAKYIGDPETLTPVPGRDSERLSVITSDGSIVGTPLYVSPEHLLGKPIDKSADVYSLGVTLYEMVTGRPPFTGIYNDVIRRIKGEDSDFVLAEPADLRKDTPRRLNRLILKMMARNPADRPTLEDVILELEEIKKGEGVLEKVLRIAGSKF